METIGRYQIQGELGRGGMAVVYRAIDPNIGREVALKLLPRELSPDADFRARFQREVRTVGSLRNPAIVPLYDADEVNGQPYLVMALMSGGSLLERLKQGPIPLTETTLMINRLAPALDEAHSKGIIHRDLKPGNILLDETGAPYLSDFGIVKLVEATSMTSRGVVGTPAYMSPEHFRGQVTPQSDIYAMGVILFQMLTGRLPFQAQTPPEWMHAHIYETPPAIRAVNSHLPPAVEPVVNRALAKEPGQRFGTTVELARALATAGRQGSEESPTVVATDQLWLTDPAGGRYPLRRGTITLGRSSQCDVVVNDHLASRQHATLEYDGQRCVVYDEGSANGTFINDQRVGSQGRPFQPGDRLRIGQTDYGLTHQAGEPVAGPVSPAVDTRAETGYGATVPPSQPLTENKQTELLAERSGQPGWLWAAVGGAAGVILMVLVLGTMVWSFSGESSTPPPELAEGGVASTSSATATPVPPTDTSVPTNTPIPPTDTLIETVTSTNTPESTPNDFVDPLSISKNNLNFVDVIQVFNGHTEGVMSVTFSPDNDIVASSSRTFENLIFLWSVSTGSLIKNLEGHSDSVMSVSFSPDGNILASGSYDKEVRLWSMPDGSLINVLKGHSGGVSSVSFSPDGKLLASGSDDTSINLWSMPDGSLINTLKGHSGGVSSVSFSPDGNLLASGGGLSDNTIRLWSVSDGSLIKTIEGHSGGVRSVSFSPDGNLLASGSNDDHINLWSVPDGSLINTIEGHLSGVSHVNFSPDGLVLASTGGWDSNYKIRLWSVTDLNLIRELEGHTGWVRRVKFSSDGKMLVSGSTDNTIRLWGIRDNMVRVPAGVFTMGSTDSEIEAAFEQCQETIGGSCKKKGFEAESPQHTVYVDEFYIDKYEVTNEQYRDCVEAGDCDAPGCEELYNDSDRGDHPVVCVNWQMSRDYCAWTGKRLPTEAEWEKAARGTDGRVYPWGNEFDGSKLNFCDANCELGWPDKTVDDGYAETSPVGHYEAGRTPYGAYDMAGNVWEWTLSAYEEYPYGKNGDRNNTNKNVSRVVRGGSWNGSTLYVRTAGRYWGFPTSTGISRGFRCLRSP